MNETIIYRVIIKYSYRELFFDFTTAIDAMSFMNYAVENYAGSGDKEPEEFEVFMQMLKEPRGMEEAHEVHKG